MFFYDTTTSTYTLRQLSWPDAGYNYLNDAGQAISNSTGTVYTVSSNFSLPTCPDGYPAYARRINQLGAIVVESRNGSTPQHTYIWRPNGQNGTSGWYYSTVGLGYGFAIKSSNVWGDQVGLAYDSGGTGYGYLNRNGQSVTLNSLRPSGFTTHIANASGINDHGVIWMDSQNIPYMMRPVP